MSRTPRTPRYTNHDQYADFGAPAAAFDNAYRPQSARSHTAPGRSMSALRTRRDPAEVTIVTSCRSIEQCRTLTAAGHPRRRASSRDEQRLGSPGRRGSCSGARVATRRQVAIPAFRVKMSSACCRSTWDAEPRDRVAELPPIGTQPAQDAAALVTPSLSQHTHTMAPDAERAPVKRSRLILYPPYSQAYFP